jgi:hypothetical protein
MMGRILGNGVFAAEQKEQRLPVNTLSEGVYVFRLTDGQKVITQQFKYKGLIIITLFWCSILDKKMSVA